MGIFSLIGGAVNAAASFVGCCLGKIGPAICGIAKGIIGVVSKIPGIGEIKNVISVIEIIANVIHAVAELLGIKSEEDSEVLGAKAGQSDKTIDDFDGDAEAYICYLKEEVKLDKQKFAQMTPEEKLGCKAIGLSLETKAVENKLDGVVITPESLAVIGKIHMASGSEIDAKNLLNVIKSLKAAGITNMNDVVEYLEGKGNSDRVKTGEVLKEIIGDGAEDRINQMKDAVRRLEGGK